ncbi:unnamed protein product [Meganyctiphanes norvegica]|uniref:BTB domain-containing protein n=1 Tax=Meganyctiphanes norvegica TaxID=48144 RepID=A0AAV2SG44_MEGNR
MQHTSSKPVFHVSHTAVAMVANILSLKWRHHSSTLLRGFTSLRQSEAYSDATLTCDGRFYKVHRFVLSTCSEYLGQMFEEANLCSPATHPVIVLQDIKPEYLEALLNYMYVGEVSIPQGDIPDLIKAAKYLHIRGLNVQGDELSIDIQKETQSKTKNIGGDTTGKKKKQGDAIIIDSNENTKINSPHGEEITFHIDPVTQRNKLHHSASMKQEFEETESKIEKEPSTFHGEDLGITPVFNIDTVPELSMQHTIHSQAKLSKIPKLFKDSNPGLSSIESLSENTLTRTVAINDNNDWLQSIHNSEIQEHETSKTNTQKVESENQALNL